MARITVEDCLEHIDNRFNLVLLATRRARQLANGVQPTLPWANDKPTVVALREIAAGTVSKSSVREAQEEIDQRNAAAEAFAATAQTEETEDADSKQNATPAQ